MATEQQAAITEPSDADEAVAWHAAPADAVWERLDTAPGGLDPDEAARRLAEVGPNTVGSDEPPSAWLVLVRQFASPLIWILLVAAVVTVAIGEYVDTGVIVAVLVLNATIGFTQERKAEKSVRALMQLAAPTSTVRRGGRLVEVRGEDLVPGDVVVLESGVRVPADLRIVEATALEVDESLLTGESRPVGKTVEPVRPDALAADRTCMAHMGSAVASGRGRGVVVATGVRTQLGQIAESIRTEIEPETPLTRRMRRFANIIAVAVGGAAVAAFALGLAVGEPLGEMFLTAVALAVAIVPEGLPIALTVAMALGVRRMAQRNAIIRNLPAVETLGSTQVIGSDKTGTLTENRMTVTRLWTPDGLWAVRPQDATDDAPPLAPTEIDTEVDARADARSLTLAGGVLSNEADLVWPNGDEPEVRGEPTEGALLLAAWTAGIDPVSLRDAHRTEAEQPFESVLAYSASLRTHEDVRTLWVKGAPERVVDFCTRMRRGDTDIDLDQAEVLAAAEAMAHAGLRVLAVAARPDAPAARDGRLPEPSDLVLVGLQGMLDPARQGVPEAIAGCREAGMRVVMITGDHAVTARAIAHDIGITSSHGEVGDGSVLTGRDMESIDDATLRDKVRHVDVFARVAPEHKHRIVKALQHHGDITAVTGDGVNDGPALKAADIGVAMGQSGTDVAREASDMVLTDDNFVSIYAAVEEGRVVFENVRKVTYFLLSTGVAAIAVLLYSLGAGLTLPLLPAQLLWLNVVTNGLQDVALAFEPGERHVLDRPPRRREEPIVSRLLWERTAFTGLTMAVGALWLYHWAIDQGFTLDQQRTVALTTLVLAMAFHVYNARSERRSFFALNPLRNPFLLAATAGALTIHALALQWEPTQFVLRVAPVDAGAWLRMVTVAASVVVVSELHKLVRHDGGRSSENGPTHQLRRD